MMTAKEKLQRASASVAFDGIFKYIKKKPQENLLKLIDISQKFMGGAFPEKNFDAFRKAVKDESNVWNHFAMNIINECDLELSRICCSLSASARGSTAPRR